MCIPRSLNVAIREAGNGLFGAREKAHSLRQKAQFRTPLSAAVLLSAGSVLRTDRLEFPCRKGFGTVCAHSRCDSKFNGMSWATMKLVTKYEGPGCHRAMQVDKKQPRLGVPPGFPVGTIHTTSGAAPFPVAQLSRVWQRHRAGTRTDASVPRTTGQPLMGMRRVGSLPGRCQNSPSAPADNQAEFAGHVAAARELSVRSISPTPKILSAIHEQDRRKIPPCPIPSGGEPCCEHWLAVQTSLRSTRTVPPRPGHHPSSGRTHSALPGATGVDSKTGAAIHQSVAPGESE